MSDVLGIEVRSVQHERIGDGLVGLNLRVAVDAAAEAPASVVIKLPSLDPTSRSTGVSLRNYEREVKFYDHIAESVDIRVPRCFHSDWDEATGDFVLVLEDMAPAAQGDQISGCSVEQALDAVRELARLHGPRWNDETLDEHEFLSRPTAESAEQLVGLWQMVVPGFHGVYDRYLTPEMQSTLGAFGDRLADWVGDRRGARAVTHGDYRLDNLLFATPEGGPPVTAVDWQTPGHGMPIGDLAYFCGAGLLSDQRREVERDLVEAYVTGLRGYGVDVDDDWVWNQYRREAFAGVVMSVVASQIVGESERSEAMFAAMATRHLQHAIDLDALDLVG